MPQRILSTDPNAGEAVSPAASGRILSTDPDAGESLAPSAVGRVLSTDPNAGELPDERSLLTKTFDVLTTPLVPQIETGARALASQLVPSVATPLPPMNLFEQIAAGAQAVPDVLRGLVAEPAATLRGGVAGLIEGAGQVASQMTSPLDLALTATGLRGLRGAAPLTSRTAQLVGHGLLGARGIEQVATAETPGEVGAGALQTALALAGGRQALRPRPTPTVPPAARVMPETPIPRPGAAPAAAAPTPRTFTLEDLRRVEETAAPGPRQIALEDLMPTEQPPAVSMRAQGKPIADVMKGTEPFIQKFPEEMRAPLRDVLERNQGFAAQRRGVMPQELTDSLANQIEVDATRSLAPGTALNAETLRAYINATATTQQNVRNLAAKVASAEATDADRLALATAQAEHQTILASVMGARAETGRALSSFRMLAKALDTGDANIIRAALKAPGLRGSVEELAAGIAKLPDDPLARYQFLKEQAQPTGMEKLRSYYYANILSGAKTHERNFLGNAFNTLNNVLVTPAAAATDIVRSRMTGQPRTVYAGEIPQQVVGASLGVQKGLNDFLFTLKHGISPRGLAGVETGIRQGQFDLPRVEFRGGGANPFNYPGRMLDATDALFRSIAKNQEHYGSLYAQAKKEGLTGDALRERMAELQKGGRANDLADQTLANELEKAAETFAQRSVFQEPGGAITRAMQGLQRIPGGAFVMPFVRTPANILRQGLEFSPAGGFMKGARAGGRAGSQAQGRALAGSLALWPLVMWASEGKLSGSGPSDPAERAALMESGWRPNSVKIGDTWVSYNLFQPISVPASMVANAFESWKESGEPPSASTVGTMIFRTARSFLDQSFMSGLFDLQAALENPDAFAERYLGRLASGAVPFSGALRTVQQAMDPTVRQAKTFGETFSANLPGLSTQVPPRISRFGEEVEQEAGPLWRAFDPLLMSSAVADPIAQELLRLDVDVAPPTPRISLETGRVLSREEEQQVKQAKGREVRESLEALFSDPAYPDLNDDTKRLLVERIIRQGRTRATKRLKGELLEQ